MSALLKYSHFTQQVKDSREKVCDSLPCIFKWKSKQLGLKNQKKKNQDLEN